MNVTSQTSRLATEPDLTMTETYGITIDQTGVSPALRRVIDKSPTRHKLNLLFVLWPPLILMLDCVSRRITASDAHADLTDQLISRAIISGVKAADGVRGYTEPAWPMRVVEAFMSGTLEFVRSQVPMPCDPGSILCGSQPFCKRAQNDGAVDRDGNALSGCKPTPLGTINSA